MSPASEAFRQTAALNEEPTDKDALTFPAPDPSVPAELPMTPELKNAFQSSLRERQITLRFFSGSWSGFDVQQTGGKYNVIVTSETIYRADSQPSLIDLLQTACMGSDIHEQLDSKLQVSPPSSTPYLCLVAAKVFYFGVGGGVTEFVQAVEKRASVETVWEQSVGVGRRIMRVVWK
jgi:protein-histidine N-methyltransferase